MFQISCQEKQLQIYSNIDKSVPKNIWFDEQRVNELLARGIIIHDNDNVFLQETQTLQIAVADTGVGVPKEDRPKLFTLFGKVEATHLLNTKGIGLGLHICRKIIQACGGDIYYDEDYGQGARFVFTIKALQKGNFTHIKSRAEEIKIISEENIQSPLYISPYRLAEEEPLSFQDINCQMQNEDHESSNMPLYSSLCFSLDSQNIKADFTPYTNQADLIKPNKIIKNYMLKSFNHLQFNKRFNFKRGAIQNLIASS